MSDRANLHDEPTEQDRIEDFDRQYENLVKTGSGVIFCPWCKKSNRPEEPACCVFFTEAYQNYGRKQLVYVQKQIREIRLGAKKSLHCPYCGTYVPKSENDKPADWFRPFVSPVCCDQMHDAVLAIIQRQAIDSSVEEKKRIEDVIVRAMAKVSNN